MLYKLTLHTNTHANYAVAMNIPCTLSKQTWYCQVCDDYRLVFTFYVFINIIHKKRKEIKATLYTYNFCKLKIIKMNMRRNLQAI